MSLGAGWTIAWMRGVATSVSANKVALTALDRAIGDGDHGENLDRGFAALIERLPGLPEDAPPGVVLKLTATTLIGTVGGAAGPLVGTAMLKASADVGEAPELDGAAIVGMLTTARDGIVLRGHAETGDKTMVDAWSPAVEAAAAALDAGRSEAEILDAAAVAAERGAAATEPLVARKGRASYLGERAVGHRDPGAQSAALILRAAAEAALAPAPEPVEGHSVPEPVEGPTFPEFKRADPVEAGAASTSSANVWSKVGLVFVSHSAKIAEGIVDLSRQLAPAVPMAAAGGSDDGEIGTSYRKTSEAVAAVDSGAGVVVLCDLGSAIMTAESVRDAAGVETRDRIHIVDAPLVEGSVAASVAAATGADLTAVVDAVRSVSAQAASGSVPAGTDHRPLVYARTATLTNDEGLHARPAAEFVKLAASFDAEVTVNGKDARSLLGILSLGLVKGREAEIVSADPSGKPAVDALAALIESGFGRQEAADNP